MGSAGTALAVSSRCRLPESAEVTNERVDGDQENEDPAYRPQHGRPCLVLTYTDEEEHRADEDAEG